MAKSNAGLPVHFFMRAGPAVVRDGRLVLTALPPRARFPVAVTVVAWQWGGSGVQTAPLIERTLMIQSPSTRMHAAKGSLQGNAPP